MSPMDLTNQIRGRIQASGPITFAEYMELALYHPRHGFFATAPIEHHFVTSVHISPMFAALLAVQVQQAWEHLGRPEQFTLVDVGAADGALLDAVVRRLEGLSVRAVAVESSDRARSRAAARGLQTLPRLDDMQSFVGVVIGNEVLDNLPFRRMRRRNGTVREVMVATDGTRLIESEAPCAEAGGDRTGEWTVSPGAVSVIRALAERMDAGYAFFFDYGFTADEPAEPIRGYRAHRLVEDVLAAPGATDITGPVDFDALVAAARDNGLQAWGPVTQRRALMALGYRRLMAEAAREQRNQEVSGDWAGAVREFAARGQASMLIDPAGLGSHKVLAIGTPGLPEPLATEPN